MFYSWVITRSKPFRHTKSRLTKLYLTVNQKGQFESANAEVRTGINCSNRWNNINADTAVNGVGDMAGVSIEENPSAEPPLSVRERLAYSFFNGADYLLKNIIGKYMLSLIHI